MKPELTTIEQDGVTIHSITWSDPPLAVPNDSDPVYRIMSELNIFIKGDVVKTQLLKFNIKGEIVSSGSSSWIQENF